MTAPNVLPPTNNVHKIEAPVTNPLNGRTELEEAERDLRRWWSNTALEEIERTVPKAVEYGGKGSAVDLIWIGQEMADTLGMGEVPPEIATELSIYFYLLGKMARWKAAIQEGHRVSDDTLFDIGVYVRMAQRNRKVGGWPFPPEDAKS